MLVDSSVWIAWLRGLECPVTRRLDGLLDEDEAYLAPVILQELLQGARNPREIQIIRQEFAAQPLLRTSLETYLTAGELYARCRWRGMTIRSPHDCLIAALAVEHALPLLAVDRDFDAIASVEPRLTLVCD